MKLNLRKFIVLTFVFLFMILSVFSTTDFAEAAVKLEKKAKVSIEATVPVFQELKIVEQADINYDFLMDKYNGSKEIMIEEALTIEVLSNANWHLRLNNRNLNSKVMIKKSRQPSYAWQNLNSTSAKFTGENGVRRITFDLKFILDQGSRAAVDNLGLDLRYSLAPELY